MDVSKRDLRDGACNFCRGDYSTGEFKYNYEFVYEIKRTEGGSLCARICKDCISDLNKKIKDDDV